MFKSTNNQDKCANASAMLNTLSNILDKSGRTYDFNVVTERFNSRVKAERAEEITKALFSAYIDVDWSDFDSTAKKWDIVEAELTNLLSDDDISDMLMHSEKLFYGLERINRAFDRVFIAFRSLLAHSSDQRVMYRCAQFLNVFTKFITNCREYKDRRLLFDLFERYLMTEMPNRVHLFLISDKGVIEYSELTMIASYSLQFMMHYRPFPLQHAASPAKFMNYTNYLVK